jgi:hypothetical protein
MLEPFFLRKKALEIQFPLNISASNLLNIKYFVFLNTKFQYLNILAYIYIWNQVIFISIFLITMPAIKKLPCYHFVKIIDLNIILVPVSSRFFVLVPVFFFLANSPLYVQIFFILVSNAKIRRKICRKLNSQENSEVSCGF